MTVKANLRFEEGKKNADEMTSVLIDLNNYINKLQNIVDNLTWKGNNATRFKNEVEEIKANWDMVYKNTLLPVPVKIKNRIENYERFENNQ